VTLLIIFCSNRFLKDIFLSVVGVFRVGVVTGELDITDIGWGADWVRFSREAGGSIPAGMVLE